MTAPLYSFKHYLKLRDGDQDAQALLKAAMLFYEEICFVGPSSWTDAIADIVCQGTSLKLKKVRSILRDLDETAFEDLVQPTFALACLELWAHNHPDLGLDSAKLTTLIEKIRENPMEVYTSPLFPLFSSLRFGFYYHSDREELDEMVEFFDGLKLPSVSVSREIEILLPPVNDLSYEAIMKLRDSPYLPQFRTFLADTQTPRPNRDELQNKVQEALWEVVGKNKPVQNGSVWSRTLAAAPVPVPLPLPNPYGVYREWKEGQKERNLFKSHGWIWFIQEVRERSEIPSK